MAESLRLNEEEEEGFSDEMLQEEVMGGNEMTFTTA
jgi:hypothetical protein